MLDDEHGVAEVAQPLERRDEAGVVDRVQADRWLVADVEHAHQAGADLRREPDALALAAAERAGHARERQVFEADVDQEGEAGVDLLEDLAGYRQRALREDLGVAVLGPSRLGGRERHHGLLGGGWVGALHRGDPLRDFSDREVRDLDDVAVGDGHGQGLGLQTLAAARLALEARHVALDLAAHVVRRGLLVPALEVGDDALEGMLPREGAAAAAPVLDLDLDVRPGPVEQELTLLLGKLAPRHVGREAERVGDAAQQPVVPAAGGTGARPRLDRTLGQRQVRVRHDQRRVDHQPAPDSGADGAGTVRAVEAERARLDLREADAARRAGELLGVDVLVAALHVDRQHAPLAEAQRGLDGVDDPAALRVAVEHEAVDDHLDGVPLELGELDALAQVADLSVDAHADEAGLGGFFEDLLVLALLVHDAGRQQHQPGALLRQHRLGDLLHGLALDGPAAVVAVRLAHAGEEQAEVVVDLGDGPDGRARVVRDALLVDGDRGREALDVVDVRLVHAAEELAGVGGQRLDVAALALGVDGVEGERRLAGARRAGDNHQLAAGDGDVDVLEVVLARASDDDVFERHVVLWSRLGCADCVRRTDGTTGAAVVPF